MSCAGGMVLVMPRSTWRAKFAGMTVPDARRLKDLEAENGRLKKLLAEARLDIEALKVVARGKG